jgi:hypothetical protein
MAIVVRETMKCAVGLGEPAGLVPVPATTSISGVSHAPLVKVVAFNILNAKSRPQLKPQNPFVGPRLGQGPRRRSISGGR